MSLADIFWVVWIFFAMILSPASIQDSTFNLEQVIKTVKKAWSRILHSAYLCYNITMTLIKHTIIALARDIIYTPVWWYTGGAVFIYRWLVRTSMSTWMSLGLYVWIKNIFTPMFQQYDWQGRIISFFMRLIQIIFRFIGFVVLFLLYLTVFLAWFAIPIFAVYVLFSGLMISFIPLR